MTSGFECQSLGWLCVLPNGTSCQRWFRFVRHRVVVCRQVVILQDVMHFGCEHEVQDGQFGRIWLGSVKRGKTNRLDAGHFKVSGELR